MAAGLDVAAGALGIVGVAGQLASSILKIKNFCKDVKNAPEELLDTIGSVENFSKILIRLGEGQTRDLKDIKNGDILRESLSICKKAADRVATLAMDLQLETQFRGSRAAIKTVLKQKTVNAMLQQLDRSKLDLQLACTMFSDACRRREYSVIEHYMREEREERMHNFGSTSTVVQHQDFVDDDSLCRTREPGKMRSKGQAYHGDDWKHNTRIRLPSWLCRYAWDVAFTHACGQWTFSFKNFKIIDESHPAWRMAFNDDVHGIRELLERRELSVHDEFSDGNTLLNVSIYTNWY